MLRFDEIKATQAAACFLRMAGGRLQYLALIKLLYKLDRAALDRWGLPVTTDHYASLKYGPIVRNTYNLIKKTAVSSSHPTFWGTHIDRDRYDVVLKLDPGATELSQAEECLAGEIFSRDGNKDGFALADESHRDFREWQDPGESSIPITVEDILSALEKSEDEVAHIESSIDAQRALSRLAR
jgi:hypothetical protein